MSLTPEEVTFTDDDRTNQLFNKNRLVLLYQLLQVFMVIASSLLLLIIGACLLKTNYRKIKKTILKSVFRVQVEENTDDHQERRRVSTANYPSNYSNSYSGNFSPVDHEELLTREEVEYILVENSSNLPSFANENHRLSESANILSNPNIASHSENSRFHPDIIDLHEPRMTSHVIQSSEASSLSPFCHREVFTPDRHFDRVERGTNGEFERNDIHCQQNDHPLHNSIHEFEISTSQERELLNSRHDMTPNSTTTRHNHITTCPSSLFPKVCHHLLSSRDNNNVRTSYDDPPPSYEEAMRQKHRHPPQSHFHVHSNQDGNDSFVKNHHPHHNHNNNGDQNDHDVPHCHYDLGGMREGLEYNQNHHNNTNFLHDDAHHQETILTSTTNPKNHCISARREEETIIEIGGDIKDSPLLTSNDFHVNPSSHLQNKDLEAFEEPPSNVHPPLESSKEVSSSLSTHSSASSSHDTERR